RGALPRNGTSRFYPERFIQNSPELVSELARDHSKIPVHIKFSVGIDLDEENALPGTLEIATCLWVHYDLYLGIGGNIQIELHFQTFVLLQFSLCLVGLHVFLFDKVYKGIIAHTGDIVYRNL